MERYQTLKPLPGIGLSNSGSCGLGHCKFEDSDGPTLRSFSISWALAKHLTRPMIGRCSLALQWPHVRTAAQQSHLQLPTLPVDNAQGGLPGIIDLVKPGSQSPSSKGTQMKQKFYMSKVSHTVGRLLTFLLVLDIRISV